MGLAEQTKRIDFPKVYDPRGALTYVYNHEHVPFRVRRVYYLYDVPGGAERGGHAHKDLEQVVVAIMGSFDLILDDGKEKQRIHLNRSYNGVYIKNLIWREMDNFSSGAICMVMASSLYEAGDYVREYEEFLRLVKEGQGIKDKG
jgi:hypothetical protein